MVLKKGPDPSPHQFMVVSNQYSESLHVLAPIESKLSPVYMTLGMLIDPWPRP
jgi:hypothetical protein